MNPPKQVLLLSRNENDYLTLSTLISQLKKDCYKLDWVNIDKTKRESYINLRYDLYILDNQVLTPLNCSPILKTELFTQKLSQWVNKLAPIPIVLLTKDRDLGIVAIDLGLADYWPKDELNLSLIERSLRLILTSGQTHEQLKAFDQQIPVQMRQQRVPQNNFFSPSSICCENFPQQGMLGYHQRENNGLTDEGYENEALKLLMADNRLKYQYSNLLSLSLTEEAETSETEQLTPRPNLENHKPEESLYKPKMWQNTQEIYKLMEILPVCISYVDAEQRYRFANKNYEHWFGRTQQDILGKTLKEVLGEEAYQVARHNIQKALRGEKVTYEATLPYKDGGTRYVLGNLIPDIDDKGEVKGYYALITDISDRKQAEEKLRYRLVLETAIALISKELATLAKADLSRMLQILAIAVRASRAYIVRFYNGLSLASMIYEWCDCETECDLPNFQNQDLSVFPWWVSQLKKNKSLIIKNVAELPEVATAEKQYLSSRKVNSVLAVGIYNASGKLWGQIGLDTTGDKQKNWLEEDAQLLQVVGEMLYRYHERIDDQEKLQASESLYSSIFNHSADPIFLVKVLPNEAFIYETVNPAYEQATGFKLKEIIGKSPREIFSFENAVILERWYRKCLALKETLFYEEVLDLPIGKRIWRTNLVPIADSQGKIMTLQGSSRDITEERKNLNEQIRFTRYQRLLAFLTIKIRQSWDIEETLQTAVNEIKTTLNAERVLFLKMLPEGKAKVVNEAVVSDIPSLINRVFADDCFLKQSQTRYLMGNIKECSNVAQADFQDCYRDLLEEAKIQSYLILPILIDQPLKPSSQGTLWGFLSVQQCSSTRQWKTEEIDLLRQLTNQLSIALNQAKLREQEIQQKQELARSNADLENFAYIVSHDLQDPLGLISSYGQLLNRRYQGQLDAKADKYIEQILKATKRMSQQIEDLLQYSRVGTRSQRLQVIDFHWVLQQAIANLQVTIAKNQATIEVETPLLTLVVDPSQLIQVFQNLISNGIKYRGEDPPLILIRAEAKGDNWLFSCKDNGIGIEDKYYERIFQVFQRLHTQDEYPGTGIGLAICQRIIQRHGGRLWVESEFGQGSTFYFTLPMSHYSFPEVT